MVRPRDARLQVLREFWYYFSINRGAVIGLVVFVLLILVALFAPLLAPHSPYEQFREDFLKPPFWEEGGSTSFLLGTDAVGRDILSRLIYGARFSLAIGFVVVTTALVSGIILGLLAGYCRGWVDTLIMRVMDIDARLPVAASGAGPGGDPRAWAGQCDDRHRFRAAAAFCPADAGSGDGARRTGNTWFRPRLPAPAISG